jgi:hypothetical protein
MVTLLRGLLLTGLAGGLCAADAPPTAAAVAAELRQASLDPASCVRVRDLEFNREDLRFYFNDGFLIFSKPVHRRRLFAVFVAGETGDDAEFLFRPPNRGERAALATFAGSPNLDEHFRSAVFLFTDDSAEVIQARLREGAAPKPNPDRGLLLADQYSGVIRNFGSSFAVRIVGDLLSPARAGTGFFFGAITSVRLGNFDVVHDPGMREQIAVGQVAQQNSESHFNIWASFQSRSVRQTHRQTPDTAELRDFRIEAAFEPDMALSAVTRITMVPKQPGMRVLEFEIAPQMVISAATLDGAPIEVFRRESMRDALIRGSNNDQILAVFPAELQPGTSYQLEFRHKGNVVATAGRNVFTVRARMNWYPNHGLQFAKYDLTFRAPKELDVVATGALVEEKIEGDYKITHRRTSAPVRLAGFNLGTYRRATVQRGGYTVEVCGNRSIEDTLQTRTGSLVVVPQSVPRAPGRRSEIVQMPAPIPPDPSARLTDLATEIAGALEWMSQQFGPPPLSVLTVSPIPGSFGQGFPGLIYLSTLSFLSEADRPAFARAGSLPMFYSEIIHAHETAHQWWGNLVPSATYHDEWLPEALANYSALLVLEKKKGARAVETTLDEYARNLASKTKEGKTIESTGPITWGQRLHSTPGAWRTIVYDKGSWIMHMLRRRMGDAQFLKFLRALREQYEYKGLTTEEFQQLAAKFSPKGIPDADLEGFFDQWVYSTGIPALSMTHSYKNLRVTGTVRQSGVGDDFSIDVPVEIRLPGNRTITQWVRTSSDPIPFSVAVSAVPLRVELGPVLQHRN